jgi:hypothetical protein
VDYVDRTLVSLAGAATRAAVFDQASLEQVLECGYDVTAMGVAGPFTPVFDDLRLGVATPRMTTVSGDWITTGEAARTEARFRLEGLGAPGPRIDALWRGSITAHRRLGGEPVTDVSTSSADGKLISATLTYAPPQRVSTTPEPIPVAVALLVRDPATITLAEMLSEARLARDRLAPTGVEVPAHALPHLRNRLVVAFVVPATWFDDSDWPGAVAGAGAAAANDQRRSAASALLAEHGIGLVVAG